MNSPRFPIPLIVVIAVCVCLNTYVYGQEEANGVRTVANFNGFELGYGYPYVTRPWQNRIVNREFDFGLQVNYLIGRSYPSGNSLGLRPGISYASIGESSHLYEYKKQDGTVSYSRKHITEYKSLSINLTGLFEFKLFKVKFGLGVFYSTPLHFSGTVISIEHGNHGQNNYNYDFSSRFRPNIGANAKMFIPFPRTIGKEDFLSIEYSINANPTWETYTQEHWVMISFIRRSRIIKEVPQKWDRYFRRNG